MSVDGSCNLDQARWRIEVDTDAWASNARLIWTLDGEYAEQHPMQSVKAAEDGTSDRLRVDLFTVDDWRDAQPGNTTAFDCRDTPSAMIQVFDRDGTASDCVRFGLQPSLVLSLDGAPDCPRVWVP